MFVHKVNATIASAYEPMRWCDCDQENGSTKNGKVLHDSVKLGLSQRVEDTHDVADKPECLQGSLLRINSMRFYKKREPKVLTGTKLGVD